MSTTLKQATRRQARSVWSNAEAKGMIQLDVSDHLQGADVLGRLIAFAILVLCLPFIALLILLVRLTSKGPGLYKQVRVGKDGKIFVMYKLRSMVSNAEEGTGPVWTQNDGDPRITSVGKFLRKSHLDELPQLANVVRGEMGLFGPRPERPELVHVLADHVDGYLNRLAVKPGITGLAQINLPPDTDLESVRRKLVLDSEYIRTANYMLEFRMFVWTGLRLVGIPSSLATKFLGLSRNVDPVKPLKDSPVTIAEILQECEAQQQKSVPKKQQSAPIQSTPILASKFPS